jgi:hypothetical protein
MSHVLALEKLALKNKNKNYFNKTKKKITKELNNTKNSIKWKR